MYATRTRGKPALGAAVAVVAFCAATATSTTPASAAEDTYAAIAYSPYDGAYGATEAAPTQQSAIDKAKEGCLDARGAFCQSVGTVMNGCILLRVRVSIPGDTVPTAPNTPNPFYVATGPNEREAEVRASQTLSNGNFEQRSYCSWNQPFTKDSGTIVFNSAPPPSTLVVEFDDSQVVKGQWSKLTVIVHIANNEDKPAVNCTYKADGDPVGPRPFKVTGDKLTTIPIEGIAPGKNWDVTAMCDGVMPWTGNHTF